MSLTGPGAEADASIDASAAPDRIGVRLRLDLAYDGTGFSGWATQPGFRTVQGVLEDTLAMILRLPEARLTVAGRTDAGVHARGQVCHLDVAAKTVLGPAMTPVRLATRLASALPADIRVRSVGVAPPGFDARFSASWRRYAYRICDAPALADPLARGHVLDWPRHLDETAMNAAGALLVGEHDFAAFCKRREGATTIRALRALEWTRAERVLTARVVADAFCHHMVRSLVGSLLAIGEGRRPVEWPADVLRAGRRDPAVKVVAAHGLTLEEVGYPPDSELAARALRSRVVRTLP